MNDIYLHSFQSVNEFNTYIESAPTNGAFSKRDFLATEEYRPKFYGTESMDEARQLIKSGYAQGMKELMSGNGHIQVPQRPRNKRVVDIVGGTPHIVNAIIGLPKTMIRTQKVQPKTPTIRLFLDLSADFQVDAYTLAKGGKNAMALLKHLENNGVRVEFNAMIAISKGEEGNRRIAIMSVVIKKYQQAISPMLCSYPITHPSFFRRQGFRWIETSWATDHKEYVGGYGTPLHAAVGKDKVYDLLKTKSTNNKTSVLKENDYYLSILDSAKATSIEDLLSKIRFQLK